MKVITGRRPIFATSSIVASGLAILGIIIGFLLMTVFSVDGNWGYIILGILVIAGGIIAGAVGIVLSIIALMRKESRRVAITAMILCIPFVILGIALLISNLVRGGL